MPVLGQLSRAQAKTRCLTLQPGRPNVCRGSEKVAMREHGLILSIGKDNTPVQRCFLFLRLDVQLDRSQPLGEVQRAVICQWY
ncbi:hypothetical protein D3C86_1590780 [compost metagenome]